MLLQSSPSTALAIYTPTNAALSPPCHTPLANVVPAAAAFVTQRDVLNPTYTGVATFSNPLTGTTLTSPLLTISKSSALFNGTSSVHSVVHHNSTQTGIPTGVPASVTSTASGSSSSTAGAKSSASSAASSASSSSTASATHGSSNAGSTPGIGAGKAVALVGALAGLVLCGL